MRKKNRYKSSKKTGFSSSTSSGFSENTKGFSSKIEGFGQNTIKKKRRFSNTSWT